jgi:hypothetical protein
MVSLSSLARELQRERPRAHPHAVFQWQAFNANAPRLSYHHHLKAGDVHIVSVALGVVSLTDVLGSILRGVGEHERVSMASIVNPCADILFIGRGEDECISLAHIYH